MTLTHPQLIKQVERGANIIRYHPISCDTWHAKVAGSTPVLTKTSLFAPGGRYTGTYIVSFDVVASKRPNSRFLSGAWHFARLLDVIFDGVPEYQSTDGQAYVGRGCIIHTLYMDI
ncbi:hypothetical protein E4T42_05417 [Aureobasidium subglaciale]|nr:hypothetical protein E4T42_05417 [Aureobasidium subglaciale]